jgi:hypothetical protein
MRIKSLALVIFLTTPGLAFAACSDFPSHAEQRHCLELEAAKLSHQIEMTQAVLRDRISAWDEDAGYKSRALALFVSAASRFQAFTAAQCTFEASAAAGGNGAGDMQLECQISLGRAYLKSLQEQATWFPSPHA